MAPSGSDTHAEPAALRWLGTSIDGAIIGLGGAVVALVFVNVLSRGVLNIDVAWTTELAEFMMLWVTLLGTAAAARRRAHMRISELVMLAGSGARRHAIEAGINAVVALMLVLLIWYGMIIVNANWGNKMTVLYWPMAIQYASLPVGSALTLVFVTSDLVGHLRRTAPLDGCSPAD